MLSLIVARASNGVIGRDNDLPWRLAADLKRFKETTLGKPIVMGRRTWESIGKPLPGRRNCVVSRQADLAISGADVFASLPDALAANDGADEIMIIGGAGLYTAALQDAARIYLTEVHADIEGDTVFPQLAEADWRESGREDFSADESNQYDYSFVTLDRIR